MHFFFRKNAQWQDCHLRASPQRHTPVLTLSLFGCSSSVLLASAGVASHSILVATTVQLVLWLGFWDAGASQSRARRLGSADNREPESHPTSRFLFSPMPEHVTEKRDSQAKAFAQSFNLRFKVEKQNKANYVVCVEHPSQTITAGGGCAPTRRNRLTGMDLGTEPRNRLFHPLPPLLLLQGLLRLAGVLEEELEGGVVDGNACRAGQQRHGQRRRRGSHVTDRDCPTPRLGGRPGRFPGRGRFCARRPSCCAWTSPSPALEAVFCPRGAPFCCFSTFSLGPALWWRAAARAMRTVCCLCRSIERSRRSRRR